jgi:hypothetical protein
LFAQIGAGPSSNLHAERNGGNLRKSILILTILIAPVVCTAQPKRAELSLAGVQIGAPLGKVKRILGVPMRVVDIPNSEFAWRAGEREYDFARGLLVVKVVEGYYQKPGMQSEHSSGVLSVAVQGTGSIDKSVKTGLGLTLGDSLQTIRRLYGQAPLVGKHIQIYWINGNILDIDLDSQGKVAQIELSVNQE